MFAFEQIASQSRRLVLGLAVAALAVTTLIAPAGTAQAANLDPTLVMSGPTADLQAIAVGKHFTNGMWEYLFLIKNNGPAYANNVVIYKEAQLVNLNAGALIFQDNGYLSANIPAGGTYSVYVHCKPSNTFTCFQADVLAKIGQGGPTDPNLNNDTAAIK